MDSICFIPKPLDSTNKSAITKRSILQDSSRVYDPLGILSPVTIRAKLLIQELWQHSVDWDEPLDQLIRDKWRDIVTDLQNATATTMTRHYFPCETDDASPPQTRPSVIMPASPPQTRPPVMMPASPPQTRPPVMMSASLLQTPSLQHVLQETLLLWLSRR